MKKILLFFITASLCLTNSYANDVSDNFKQLLSLEGKWQGTLQRTGGQALVGAITFNAVFRDYKTKTWWRQETGEAAKGKLAGKVLKDIPMEQMSLKHWLEKHPNSAVLQYDPAYQKKYDFVSGLLKYELSLPGWHFQK